MRINALLVCCLSATTPAPAAQVLPPPRIPPTEAKDHLGTVATVCGQVVMYHCDRTDMTMFLDLDTPYWSDGISVRIPASRRALFGTRVEDRYEMRHICATGLIDRKDNRYLITVERPPALQIEREPSDAPGVLDPSAVRSCDLGVELPKLLRQVKPRYTRAALDAKIEGTVLVDGVVLTDGTVGDVRVVRSLDTVFGLDQVAVKAFRHWRFLAGTLEGRPVPVIVRVELSFTLH
jgi:TonB family protein